MNPEHLQSAQIAATLQLIGNPLIPCTIVQISPANLTLKLADSALSRLPGINVDDLAELELDNPIDQSGRRLKVRTAIETKSGSQLTLKFINQQDPAVRQLVNWLPKATSSASTSGVQILNDLNHLALQQLSYYLDSYFIEADRELLSLAEVAKSNDHQGKIFLLKAQLRENSDLIKQHIAKTIDNKFKSSAQQITKPAGESMDEMELVDIEEFEDWLSMEVIIKKANAKHQHSLQCLAKRYSSLSTQTFDEETLPVSIKNITHALQGALKASDAPSELLPIIYRIFDQEVVEHLGDLFDILNAKFKSYGVLPNIEAQLLQSQRNKPKESQAELNSKDNALSDEDIPSNVIKLPGNKQLFSGVKQILATTRAKNTNEEQVSSNNTIANDELIQTLNNLQADMNSIETVANGVSLQDWISEITHKNLDTETNDLINLVDTLFTNLNVYTQISGQLLQIIQGLQIPIAKTALRDEDFFSNEEHPAHALLNQLVDLCLDSEMPNQMLEKKFSSIVEDIRNDQSNDASVYSKANQEVANLARNQKKLSARNTSRIAQTYEGREKVKLAELSVNSIINKKLIPPKAPTLLIELIDNGWKELLKLTHIKSGPDSDSWHQYINVIDQLNEFLSNSESAIRNSVEATSLLDSIESSLNECFPGDYRHGETLNKLRDIFAGNNEIEFSPINNDDGLKAKNPNELNQELKEANPDLSRWFDRLSKLDVGDEFSYLNDESKQKNIKLAWVSNDKQQFVFVNNRGQKVFDFDQVDLARELSKGLYPTKEESEWPLVERSLYSTVQQAYEQLAYKSTHDELTDLINRKECERLLNVFLTDARNQHLNHCLLYIDVDQFSLPNNLYGHVAGDKFLQEISRIISKKASKASIIARMSGNEFVIVLKNKDMEQAQLCAEVIRAEIERHRFTWEQDTIQLTCSIGVINLNRYTESTIDLIRNAVVACKAAKDKGGNRCQEYEQDLELTERREKLLGWINKLSDLLQSDKLVLRGQPIAPVNGTSESEEPHYEILLALREDDGSLVSPVEFIEAAECYNRMQKVDRWVIENTFQWLSNLQQDGKALPFVSINLSGNSINDDQLMEFLLGIFAKYNVPTNKICFEVTETATIDNISSAADFIREIKKIGCKFSLDDFGSGNSSYQYLKHLPVDYLKIDGAFVQDIHNNIDDYALVKSINDIAHLMGKKTIAEYTETDQILDVLKDIGVDYVQGFEIGTPTILADLNIS